MLQSACYRTRENYLSVPKSIGSLFELAPASEDASVNKSDDQQLASANSPAHSKPRADVTGESKRWGKTQEHVCRAPATHAG